jgi:hypothetical protein
MAKKDMTTEAKYDNDVMTRWDKLSQDVQDAINLARSKPVSRDHLRGQILGLEEHLKKTKGIARKRFLGIIKGPKSPECRLIEAQLKHLRALEADWSLKQAASEVSSGTAVPPPQTQPVGSPPRPISTTTPAQADRIQRIPGADLPPAQTDPYARLPDDPGAPENPYAAMPDGDAAQDAAQAAPPSAQAQPKTHGASPYANIPAIDEPFKHRVERAKPIALAKMLKEAESALISARAQPSGELSVAQAEARVFLIQDKIKALGHDPKVFKELDTSFADKLAEATTPDALGRLYQQTNYELHVANITDNPAEYALYKTQQKILEAELVERDMEPATAKGDDYGEPEAAAADAPEAVTEVSGLESEAEFQAHLENDSPDQLKALMRDYSRQASTTDDRATARECLSRIDKISETIARDGGGPAEASNIGPNASS